MTPARMHAVVSASKALALVSAELERTRAALGEGLVIVESHVAAARIEICAQAAAPEDGLDAPTEQINHAAGAGEDVAALLSALRVDARHRLDDLVRILERPRAGR